VDAGDVSEEVFAYKFFLWTPDGVPVAMDDGVEVRVTLSRHHTRWCSEEVREKVEVDLDGFVVGGRRLYGGGGDGGRIMERRGWAPNDVFGRWEACEDGRWDVLDFFDERGVGKECVEIGSVGGDVSEEVQRLVLKIMELIASDGEEGVENETGWWGGDILVEEGRRWRRYLLEVSVDGRGGGVDVGLVG